MEKVLQFITRAITILTIFGCIQNGELVHGGDCPGRLTTKEMETLRPYLAKIFGEPQEPPYREIPESLVIESIDEDGPPPLPPPTPPKPVKPTTDEIDESKTYSLEELDLVPRVISSTPEEKATVVVGTGAQKLNLDGHVVGIKRLAKLPDIHWKFTKGAFYTLLFLDVTYDDGSYFIHLLDGNVQDNSLSGENSVITYVLPQDRKVFGLRSFIILIYEHANPNNYLGGGISREHFNLANFVKKFQLGQPLAASGFKISSKARSFMKP